MGLVLLSCAGLFLIVVGIVSIASSYIFSVESYEGVILVMLGAAVLSGAVLLKIKGLA